ncbi:PH domain-containing protein [Myxococcus sp. K15C18031901]|uniref:PH domain-containing protein n=1 Tax=Myxococcus dinghuensis TaxID=2906761 RepID=UPI0020A70761|nr:PH domain-containing protein [Myxococcus dinghuensis]MCP3098244.1 PH domain-containing protein [Myxococcus dinghuensis]
MADLVREGLLRLLKVDPRPHLPEGTQRVFRASPAFLTYLRILWGLKQVGVLSGLVVGWVILSPLVHHAEIPYLSPLVFYGVEVLAWGGFLLQLTLGFLVTRLNYELRWYVLSDRSLRVREGILSLREKTLAFANIQQLSIHQNPLQRLLGIADVKVETAGGGSGGRHEESAGMGERPHEAHFRGVDDAEAIRDLILARVRTHRDTGLGEPTEHVSPQAPVLVDTSLEAAHALLAEVRALRGALTGKRRAAP